MGHSRGTELEYSGHMRSLILCCTVLAACQQPDDHTPYIPDLSPDLRDPCPTPPSAQPELAVTVGERNVLHFSWDSFVAQSLDIPVATGSHVVFHADAIAKTNVMALTFASSNPAVAAVDNHSDSVWVLISAHRAGSSRITAYDSNGVFLDAVTIQVADVDGIAFAGDWLGAPGPTLVAGTTERMRIRLLHGTTELVGWGTTTFAFDGVLQTSTQLLAPSERLPSTEEVFFVAPQSGTGGITASAGTATTHVDVSAIPLAEVDEMQFRVTPDVGCRRQVGGTLRSKGTRVFGPHCWWLVPGGAAVDNWQPWNDGWADEGGWPGDHPDQRYTFTAHEPGVHTMQCRIVGAVTAPLTITTSTD